MGAQAKAESWLHKKCTSGAWRRRRLLLVCSRAEMQNTSAPMDPPGAAGMSAPRGAQEQEEIVLAPGVPDTEVPFAELLAQISAAKDLAATQQQKSSSMRQPPPPAAKPTQDHLEGGVPFRPG